MVKLRTNMEMKITNSGRGGCNDDMFTSCWWLTGGNQAVACRPPCRGDQSTTTKRVGTNNIHKPEKRSYCSVQQEPIVSVHFVSGRGYFHNNFFCMYEFVLLKQKSCQTCLKGF
jgi:hypothetical protein